jgi:hypothetical protein
MIGFGKDELTCLIARPYLLMGDQSHAKDRAAYSTTAGREHHNTSSSGLKVCTSISSVGVHTAHEPPSGSPRCLSE